MKNYIKDIYMLIIFLFAAMACSDNEELIKKDEPGRSDTAGRGRARNRTG